MHNSNRCELLNDQIVYFVVNKLLELLSSVLLLVTTLCVVYVPVLLVHTLLSSVAFIRAWRRYASQAPPCSK